MKTSTVLFDPALMMSRVEMTTKMAISMVPSRTPARVLNEMPLYSSHQVNRPQATARMAHISVRLHAEVGRDEDRPEESEASEQERGDEGARRG